MLDFLVRVPQQRRWKKNIVGPCLGAWDWWSGRGNTSVGRTHGTTDTWDNRERDAEMSGMWQFLGGLNAVLRRTPGAVQCTAPSWTSEVRMPELAACQSAQGQAVLARRAWTRRLCRLTPVPWPSPWSLPKRAPARRAERRANRGNGVRRPLRRLL